MELLNNIIEAFSFPDLASQDGSKVDGLVIAVHLLMLALFVGWIIYYFVVKMFPLSNTPRVFFYLFIKFNVCGGD